MKKKISEKIKELELQKKTIIGTDIETHNGFSSLQNQKVKIIDAQINILQSL